MGNLVQNKIKLICLCFIEITTKDRLKVSHKVDSPKADLGDSHKDSFQPNRLKICLMDHQEVHLTSLVVSAAVDQESNNPASSSPVSLFQALLNLNHHHKHHQVTKQNQPKNLTTKKKNLKRRKKKSKLAIYLNQFYVQ